MLSTLAAIRVPFCRAAVARLRRVASMFDVPFMHGKERNKFRCQAAVRSRTVELTRGREAGAAALISYTQFSSRIPETRRNSPWLLVTRRAPRLRASDATLVAQAADAFGGLVVFSGPAESQV